METSKEEFWASHDHRLHCPGVPQAEERLQCQKRFLEQFAEIRTPGPDRAKTDLAWLVMLVKQGLVSREVASRLLPILKETNAGGEDFLKRKPTRWQCLWCVVASAAWTRIRQPLQGDSEHGETSEYPLPAFPRHGALHPALWPCRRDTESTETG